MSIVYHCLTCNAPLPSTRFHICPACRQIEAIERASTAHPQPEKQWTYDSLSYSSNCSHAEVEKHENIMGLITWAIILVVDYNLNWFFAKMIWLWCKMMYLMFFSWWI